MAVPVIALDALLARNNATSAISSGCIAPVAGGRRQLAIRLR